MPPKCGRCVQSGEFGPEAKRLIGRCLAVIIAWAAILAIWFGILLYAEAPVKAQGGWPDAADERQSDRTADAQQVTHHEPAGG